MSKKRKPVFEFSGPPKAGDGENFPSPSSSLAAMPGSMSHPGVWCCEKRGQCKWKCYALETAGLQWGTPDQTTAEWIKCHKRECGGELVQLMPPNQP